MNAILTGASAAQTRNIGLLTDGPMLGMHSQALFGLGALPMPLPNLTAPALMSALRHAGLGGRGGGGFPAWRKFDALLRSGGPSRVVANVSEGEPWSAKDHALARLVPHLLLDGLAIVGSAAGTRRLHLVVAADLMSVLQQAITARGDRSRFHLRTAGDAFPSGEASAVARNVASHGRRTLPYFHSRRLTDRPEPPETPFEARQHPVLVYNAETLAWIALIARNGADWYRTYGTRLGTITGDVRRPGVFEAGPVPVSTLIDLAGGLTPVTDSAVGSSASVAARAHILVGGYAGGWIASGAWASMVWDDRALHAAQARMGPGILRVLGPQRCPLQVTANVLRTLSAESAGQCGPCVFGLPALSRAFFDALASRGRPAELARIRQLAALVSHRGACRHPDGAAGLALASLQGLNEHWNLHRTGRCQGYDHSQ